MHKMVDLGYAYANARVKALKAKLFDKDRMREIMDVGSLTEVIEMLEESPYKESFVKASTKHSGMELVKRALDEDLKIAFRKVWRLSPPSARPLLSLLLKQWEVNNVKKAVAARALGKKILATDFLLVQGERAALLEKISSQETMEGVIAVLQGCEYGAAFRRALQEYRRAGDFRILLSSLDEHYFAMISKAISSPALDARTRAFLRKKLEYAAAIAVLRMCHSGVAPAEIRKFLLRAAHGETTLLRGLVEASSLPAAVDLLADESRVDRKAMREKGARNDLPGVEMELEKALLLFARKTLSSSVLSLGALVGYLFLKQEEVHSLRKIAYATQFDVRAEIRQTVLAAV